MKVGQFDGEFQHTAARRRLQFERLVSLPVYVSTHSRPKAAERSGLCRFVPFSFNTQPPEGGCNRRVGNYLKSESFNTQPPEGGCRLSGLLPRPTAVSTHSRPKAAG